MMRAQSPAGMRPPWRSRPSWLFRVQMTASTRWRSQFGNGRGCFSSLRAGRIRARRRPSPAKNSSVPCPDRPFVGDDGGPARDRGGVHKSQQLRGRRGGVGQPAQGGLHQRRELPQPGVVLAVGRQPREQVPDQARGGAQPVPLVVVPEQDLRHGQAGELGVGDFRRPSRPGAAGPAKRDDPVGQFHVECGQEGVQVGGHDGLQGPDVWLARVQRPPLLVASGRARDPASRCPPVLAAPG